MKHIFFSTIISTVIAVTMLSCNQPENNSNNNQDKVIAAVPETPGALEKDGTPVPPATKDTANKNIESEKVRKSDVSFSMAPIVKDYLALKNALAADNDKLAADAGRKLLTTLKAADMKTIPSDKHKEYMDIADDAMENAAHIGDNAGKIAHQREHLASLSKDINDLISLFGSPQKLYQQHCPMYNEGKGAIWISETKGIRNPYYGDQMLTCGSVKKEY